MMTISNTSPRSPYETQRKNGHMTRRVLTELHNYCPSNHVIKALDSPVASPSLAGNYNP